MEDMEEESVLERKVRLLERQMNLEIKTDMSNIKATRAIRKIETSNSIAPSIGTFVFAGLTYYFDGNPYLAAATGSMATISAIYVYKAMNASRLYSRRIKNVLEKGWANEEELRKLSY